MESFNKLMVYLKANTEVMELLSDIDKDFTVVEGRLYKAERELRTIRKMINRYFKKESDDLESELNAF